ERSVNSAQTEWQHRIRHALAGRVGPLSTQQIATGRVGLRDLNLLVDELEVRGQQDELRVGVGLCRYARRRSDTHRNRASHHRTRSQPATRATDAPLPTKTQVRHNRSSTKTCWPPLWRPQSNCI